MAVITGFFLIDILIATAFVIYTLYWYLTNNNDYWDKRGVPNTIKKSIFRAQLSGKKALIDIVQELYDTFNGKRFAGYFQLKTPVLMIRDPELIHKILVKDFAYFPDRGFTQLPDNVIFDNLFNLKGAVWRALRYKLTPTFTTGKLKRMFDQISKSGDNMMEKLEELSKENIEVETKPFLFEFTLDVISSCAFGLQFKPNTPDFEKFKTTVETIFKMSFKGSMKMLTTILFPKFAKIFHFKALPEEIEDYFFNLTKTTLSYRKNNNIIRDDYFQLLITLKEQEESGKNMVQSVIDTSEDDAVINQMKYAGHDEQSSTQNIKLFTEDLVCAHSFIFLTAGSESTSSSTSLILLELARHQDIQKKLQQEIDSVLAKHEDWSYEAVKDMTYLEMVFQETQRLYPSVSFMMRECVQPYKVPESDLIIEKGVLVMIPVCGLHRDPQYYPNPEQFKPERFEGNYFKPNPTYLPFGDGPRICIAMRFAVMEVKICVAKIISQYTVKLGSKTKDPIQFEPKDFLTGVKGGVWLSFEKRKH